MTVTPRAYLDTRLLLKADNLDGLSDLLIARDNIGLGVDDPAQFASMLTDWVQFKAGGPMLVWDSNGQIKLAMSDGFNTASMICSTLTAVSSVRANNVVIANNRYLRWRDAADTADVDVVKMDVSENVLAAKKWEFKEELTGSAGVLAKVYGFSAGGNPALPYAQAAFRTANDWRIIDDGYLEFNYQGALGQVLSLQPNGISIPGNCYIGPPGAQQLPASPMTLLVNGDSKLMGKLGLGASPMGLGRFYIAGGGEANNFIFINATQAQANDIFYRASFGSPVTGSVKGLDIAGTCTDDLSISVYNQNAGPNSNSKLSLATLFGTSGDPVIAFNIATVGYQWNIGLDNSDADKFKLSYGGPTIGSGDYLIVDITGNVEIPNSLSCDDMRIPSPIVPSASSSPGSVGTVAWDNSFIYICTVANSWKRSPLGSW